MTFIRPNFILYLLIVLTAFTGACQITGSNDLTKGQLLETGIASWYGDNFHGGPTANGEIYDMEALTAAHKTLPFNSIVRVENKDNGQSVTVRINDRGPFVEGRVIDLSRRAAREIGIITVGLARVELFLLLEGE
ncbi:MAG: septal ring lytic transglycosylase RlpA family protein [Balneolaceae bacterium]